MQRLESELKFSQASAERKEQDFNLAIEARDQALSEVNKLQKQMEALEERERQQVWVVSICCSCHFQTARG